MNGVVDEGGRALLDVRISNKLQGEYSAVTTWKTPVTGTLATS